MRVEWSHLEAEAVDALAEVGPVEIVRVAQRENDGARIEVDDEHRQREQREYQSACHRRESQQIAWLQRGYSYSRIYGVLLHVGGIVCKQ